MPAIPIYTASPINATKASGVTPQTSQSAAAEPRTVSSRSPNQPSTYPAAQPGSRPSMPAPTRAPQLASNPAPTPTQAPRYDSPPAPQPGAVPIPPSRNTLPPPPKAGETLRNSQTQIMPVPMPHQIAYTPLGAPELAAPRSFTTTAMPMPAADPLGGGNGGSDFLHPPGYHQNARAVEFNSSQRAAHEASIAEGSRNMPFQPSGGYDEDGVWSTAKKWAVAAGEGLAAAEHEVWRRINKE